MRTLSYLGVALTLILGSNFGTASGQQTSAETPRIDTHAIGGVVTGAQGPEAGVWVIAETAGLPSGFAAATMRGAVADQLSWLKGIRP